MELMIRSAVHNGIPVLELWQPQLQSAPVVIAQHGYLGRKEFILPQAYNLASQGFFTIVPDAFRHGDRALGTPYALPAHPSHPLGGRDEPGLFPDLIDAAVQTALGIDGLLSAYDDDERADTARAGLTGFSMGGMVCFYYLTLPQKRIKALCPVIGSPDWYSILQTPPVKAQYAAIGVTTPEAVESLVARTLAVAPSSVTRVDPLPMLVQNGGIDELIPAQPVRDYMERIRPCYADAEQLQIDIVPGLGHSDTLEINLRLAVWFHKYL